MTEQRDTARPGPSHIRRNVEYGTHGPVPLSFEAGTGADRENENETRPDRGWQRVGDVARRLVAAAKVRG